MHVTCFKTKAVNEHNEGLKKHSVTEGTMKGSSGDRTQEGNEMQMAIIKDDEARG